MDESFVMAVRNQDTILEIAWKEKKKKEKEMMIKEEKEPNRARRRDYDRDERWKNHQYDRFKKKQNERN
jgi:hypothetical protein